MGVFSGGGEEVAVGAGVSRVGPLAAVAVGAAKRVAKALALLMPGTWMAVPVAAVTTVGVAVGRTGAVIEVAGGGEGCTIITLGVLVGKTTAVAA